MHHARVQTWPISDGSGCMARRMQENDEVKALAAGGAVELVGNRTECGLLQMAAALGADYEAIRREGRILRTFPFSSDRKRMTSLVSQPGARSALPCPPALRPLLLQDPVCICTGRLQTGHSGSIILFPGWFLSACMP